jgi:alkylated DNA nucleotide flippase Atl1
MAESSSDTQAFFNRVYGVVAQIPRGRVVSYGQIAALLG